MSIERQAQVISALVEGNSIRSTERMTGIHRDTIMRLTVRIGDACDRLMDETMRGLTCEHLQLDELWGYVGMKQKTAHRLGKVGEYGDVYTFVALDAQTKLIPAFHIGHRDAENTRLFIHDLKQRIVNRPQITTDAYQAYFGAIIRYFGQDVDYAHEQKVFASELNSGRGRYSPPVLTSCDKQNLIGDPDPAHISTSYVERQNLTIRMSMRRFTRLTNGFSKKRENMVAALCLHFAHYNFCRTHKTLKTTPAVAHGLENHIWSIEEMLFNVAATQQPEISN
ncbi:MAG TPA: IS1 family transposase [Candidatus Binataceae bacterium]|nr:IS1 family transposase [Candidatus Binataceae bacterium]